MATAHGWKLKVRKCVNVDCQRVFRSSSFRHCKVCREAVQKGMREGYLTRVPRSQPSNPDNVYRPHADEDNPSVENGVRAFEEN
jgi:hypothetical protein